MWNDKETDIDFLGYDKIADTILEIVGDNHLRPLTIGVYGDWGVGKSSILSLLQKKAAELPKEEKDKIHTIVFNGWLFQGYEDTKSALMETIITDLLRKQPNIQKVQNLAKSLLKRINWLKVAKLSAGVAWTGFTGMPHPGLLSGAVESAKKLFEKKEEKTGTHITIKQEDKESFLKEEDENVPSQIHAFRQEFKELIESSKIDQLIILVDDLDRCLPKAVIEILEAIRLFLFVEGTVFVISPDEKMIEYAVREHFPNLPSDYSEYTKNYLEKLIQIPIRIPLLNKVQTGNYIKFLMLQNHLKNDLLEVKKVYQYYELKKTLPYENIDLTYELIKEALGQDSQELRQTVLVADQLYPVLAVGLKGNPRNTKRFLNTLFLRLKVAKIYGLVEIVKLDLLAKLMLLEIFHTNHYYDLINEVSSSVDGVSYKIEEYENESKKDTSTLERLINDWNKLLPSLKGKDLRPYIFISKEKAVSFEIEQDLPSNLISLLKNLASGLMLSLNKAEIDLGNITSNEANILFDKLHISCKSQQDFLKQSNEMKGLFRIVKVFPQFELKLITFLASLPANNIGTWAISENSSLKTKEAKEKFKTLIESWNTAGNKNLKAMAKQTLKQ